MEDSFLARNQLYAMTDILAVQLRERLREDLGGVYGVNVGGMSIQHPEDSYTVTLSWSCDPDRVEELKTAALEVVDRLRNDGVDAHYVKDEKAKNRRERETKIESNAFWISGISAAMRNGWEPLELLSYDERNEALTPESVQEAARQYLNPDQYIEVVLLPEGQE